MRAVVQRVLSASVTVDGEVVGSIGAGETDAGSVGGPAAGPASGPAAGPVSEAADAGPGLLVYLGVTHDDGPDEVAWTARKVWDLRVLREEVSASDVGAPVLVVSQFTLYGDARKGRRPSWTAAAPGPVSEPLYDAFCAELERLGARVARGVFGADMVVTSVNDGPVTILLER